jgi:hypothetical protein
VPGWPSLAVKVFRQNIYSFNVIFPFTNPKKVTGFLIKIQKCSTLKL